MKFLNVSLSIILILSFLVIPTCAFADGNPSADSGIITHSSSHLNNINPMVKSSTSSSKKIKTDSDDDNTDSADDGTGVSWIWLIVAIIMIIILIIAVWYLFLRNR